LPTVAIQGASSVPWKGRTLNRARIYAGCILILGALFLGACGSDDDDDNGTISPSQTETSAIRDEHAIRDGIGRGIGV
jgi:hypothetical protein